MRYRNVVLGLISLMTALMCGGCGPVRERPPTLADSFWGIALNGGRTQAITVSPRDRDKVVTAMQFGGLWRTADGGTKWQHLDGLSEVFVHDVQYGNDGTTLVATVGRTNHVDHRGGIWVSRNDGLTWSRPSTSRWPASTRIPDRSVAHGIAVDPDDARRWYVGTDYGLAISDDNAATWRHVEVDATVTVDADRRQQAVMAVLPFPGGSVLAMTRYGIYRSDDRGAAGTWRVIRAESFGFYESSGWNKMDRSPYWPYAFILKDYSTLYLYELGGGQWTPIPLPAGASSRGPFVRIGKPKTMPGYITLWIGQGTRALKVTRRRIGSLRAIEAADWTIFGRSNGIHDDMGDLGVDAVGAPVMIGSDGGVFKPDRERPGQWVGASRVGSGMNSYQITDLAGVNQNIEGRTVTALHFSTQDNAVWASSDSGQTWPNVDCCEGFHVEGPWSTAAGDVANIAYGRVGAGYSNSRMSKRGLIDQVNLSDTATDGTSYQLRDADGGVTGSDAGQAFFIKPGYWLRGRFPSGSNQQILVSTDDGATWRKRFELTVRFSGVFQRTKTHYPVTYAKAYLPVADGTLNPDGSERVGLLRLYSLTQSRVDTLGADNMIRLPDNGSLGVRATEFDWQAVFAVHPKDWRFVIAPDIVHGDIKISRDGGDTWDADAAITALVTRNGQLRLWDGSAYMMQVTHIAFDPYREGRILVGTREAGIMCSNDGGAHWGKIPASDRVLYVTGFQFSPGGDTWVATYGRGLWKLDAVASTCVDGRPMTVGRTFLGERVPPGVLPADFEGRATLPADIPLDDEERAPPRSMPDDRPRASIDTGIASMGGAVVGEGRHVAIVYAINFDRGADLEVLLDGRRVPGKRLAERDAKRIPIEIDLPDGLGYGEHHILIRQSPEVVAAIAFRKVHMDEHLGEPDSNGGAPGQEEPSLEILEAIEAQYDAPEVPFQRPPVQSTVP